MIATVLGGTAVVAFLLGSAEDRIALHDLPAPCRASIEQARGTDFSSSKTACDIRQRYIDQVLALPGFIQAWQESGLGLEDQALCAFTIRHQVREAGRAAMPNRALATILAIRDLVVYGHPDGPTFTQLTEEHHGDGMSAAYRSILESAQTTNPWFDAQCAEEP